MTFDVASDTSPDLAAWGAPLVADRVRAAYAGYFNPLHLRQFAARMQAPAAAPALPAGANPFFRRWPQGRGRAAPDAPLNPVARMFELSVAIQRQHCRLWNALLLARNEAARAERRVLLQMAQQLGVTPAQIDEIDRLVLDELLAVIIARFARTRAAHSYGMTLVAAATCLGEARMVA